MSEHWNNHVLSTIHRTVGNEMFEKCSVDSPESEVWQGLKIVEHTHGEVTSQVRLVVELLANVGAQVG